MKRAFDANVSKARPRTRTQVLEKDAEAPLTADLAAALVGGRRPRTGMDARRAQAVAAAAGEAAATVSRASAHEAPVRRDALVHAEEQLAHQAGDSAHGAARNHLGGEERKQGLARAMRFAAARAAEVAGEVAAAPQARKAEPAAGTPEWVVRAAVPVDADDILAEELIADLAAARRAQRIEAEPARTAAAAKVEAPVAKPMAAAAVPAKPAVAEAKPPARPAPPTPAPTNAEARLATAAAAVQATKTGASTHTTTALQGPKAEALSADLAATMKSDLRAAAPKARVLEAQAPVARDEALSADLARTLATAARPRLAAPGEETVHQGRARIAELRDRLAAASRPRQTAEEIAPENAAAAVRRAVDDLRARLTAALSERDTMARTLEVTRDELASANRQLTERTRALEAAQALAAERAGVAEELAAEAEALAEERDQALARILDLKSLDEQQTKLLADAEAALAERDSLLKAAEDELGALATTLDVRAAEIEELGALVEERTRERDQLARRVAQLEADVHRLAGTREALAEIQRLVTVTPGR